MKKILENPVINLIARLVLGYIFIKASVGKIVDPSGFANEIANYQIMFHEGLHIIALILPWLEFLLAVMLILGIRLRASAILSSALMVVFIGAVLSAMARGLDISCGCFGPSSDKVGWNKVFENLGYLILSVYIWIYPMKDISVERLFIKNKD